MKVDKNYLTAEENQNMQIYCDYQFSKMVPARRIFTNSIYDSLVHIGWMESVYKIPQCKKYNKKRHNEKP